MVSNLEEFVLVRVRDGANIMPLFLGKTGFGPTPFDATADPHNQQCLHAVVQGRLAAEAAGRVSFGKAYVG